MAETRKRMTTAVCRLLQKTLCSPYLFLYITGTNMDVTYVPIDEKLEKSKGDPGLQALSEIQAATASGYGKVTNPSYVEFVPRYWYKCVLVVGKRLN